MSTKITSNIDQARYHARLGEANRHRGSFWEAIGEFDKALEHLPSLLGHGSSGDRDGAQTLLTLEEMSLLGYIYSHRGAAKTELGLITLSYADTVRSSSLEDALSDFNRAIAILKRALKVKTNEDLQYELGWAYAQRGEAYRVYTRDQFRTLDVAQFKECMKKALYNFERAEKHLPAHLGWIRAHKAAMIFCQIWRNQEVLEMLSPRIGSPECGGPARGRAPSGFHLGHLRAMEGALKGLLGPGLRAPQITGPVNDENASSSSDWPGVGEVYPKLRNELSALASLDELEQLRARLMSMEEASEMTEAQTGLPWPGRDLLKSKQEIQDAQTVSDLQLARRVLEELETRIRTGPNDGHDRSAEEREWLVLNMAIVADITHIYSYVCDYSLWQAIDSNQTYGWAKRVRACLWTIDGQYQRPLQLLGESMMDDPNLGLHVLRSLGLLYRYKVKAAGKQAEAGSESQTSNYLHSMRVALKVLAQDPEDYTSTYVYAASLRDYVLSRPATAAQRDLAELACRRACDKLVNTAVRILAFTYVLSEYGQGSQEEGNGCRRGQTSFEEAVKQALQRPLADHEMAAYVGHDPAYRDESLSRGLLEVLKNITKSRSQNPCQDDRFMI